METKGEAFRSDRLENDKLPNFEVGHFGLMKKLTQVEFCKIKSVTWESLYPTRVRAAFSVVD